MRVAIGAVGLNFVLNVSLIWWLQEAGLAWATSLSAMVQTLVLWWLLQRRLRSLPATGSIFDAFTLNGMARVFVASLLMGGLVVSGLLLIPRTGDWWLNLARLGAATVLGTVGMIGFSKLLLIQELRWLFTRSTR
jgi:putative peptidoglycan lipid II flippase